MLIFLKLDSRNAVSMHGVQNFVEQNLKTTAVGLVGLSIVGIIGARYFLTRPPLIDSQTCNGLEIALSSRGKDLTTMDKDLPAPSVAKVRWAAQVYKWNWSNLSWIPDGHEQYCTEDK